jgi:flagellar basal-body rod protein FlgG
MQSRPSSIAPRGGSTVVRGLQFAAAAMTAEQTRQDAIAHNLANASTPGFRRILVALESGAPTELHRRDRVAPSAIGDMGAGPDAPRVVVDIRQGSLAQTGDKTDLAIDGPGFLAAEGGRYVRSGRLGVDTSGNLTIGGVRVVGENAGGAAGPLKVGDVNVVIGEDGSVRRVSGEGLGRLRLVSIEARALAPAGDGVYRVLDARGVKDGAGSVLRQGVREHSNVNPVEEMVQMIAGMRSYEAAMRVIQTTDESLARAAEQVGKVG